MTTQASAQLTDEATPVSKRRLTVGLCINVVAIAFETVAVATAMPAAARDLDGLDYYAWAFSLFVIGMLFSTVVAGRLSDRIGPARPLLAGFAVFVVGLFVAGTAGHMVQLVAGRLVQGLGSGLINTAVFVCVAQVYSAQQRPRIFTYISTAWVLPSFVGPPVSAWLTNTFSWHWVFFAVVPMVVGGALLVLPTLRVMMATYVRPEASPDGARPAPLWAAAVVAVCAAAIQLAGQRLDWVALGLFVAGLVGLVLALPRLMPAGRRLGRGLPAVMGARGFLAGAFVGAEAFVPLMLVEQRHAPLVWAGAALTVGSVGWTFASWVQSQRWFRLRRDRVIALGCLSLAFGLVGTALVALFPVVPAVLVAGAWVFSGLGMGFATSSTALAVMTLSLEAEQGRNASSLNLSDSLGAGLFVGVSGTLFAYLHDRVDLALTFGPVVGTMAVVALLAAAFSMRIGAVRNESAAG